MGLTALVFTPKAPFRGEITTNTLFGAICWGLRKFYGERELKDFLERFKESDPPFLFSSPLPVDPKGKVWFFRPPLEGSIFDTDDPKKLESNYPLNKVFKKLKLLEWKLLEKILKGEIKTEKELFEEVLKRASSNGEIPKEIDRKRELLEKYLKRSPSLGGRGLSVKTAIDRLTNTAKEGNLFNEIVQNYDRFAVIFKVFNTEIFKKVKVALKVVRLGGNRSVGLGRFELEENEKVIPEGLENFLKEGKKIYLLSPSFFDENIELEESLYEVKAQRSAVDKTLGYFDAEFLKLPVWKKTAIYLKEGSVLNLKKPSRWVGGLKTTLSYNGISLYSYGIGFGLSFL